MIEIEQHLPRRRPNVDLGACDAQCAD